MGFFMEKDQEIEIFSVLIYGKKPTGDHERGNVVDRSGADITINRLGYSKIKG